MLACGGKELSLQVPAADYGLNILDILRAPEKELNQVIGLKRLAPYRDDGGRFRPNMAKLKDMQVNAPLQSPTLPDCYPLDIVLHYFLSYSKVLAQLHNDLSE